MKTRILLQPEDKAVVEEICRSTGITSNSEAVAMLIRRYGRPFLEWWNSDPNVGSVSPPPPTPFEPAEPDTEEAFVPMSKLL